MNNTITNILIVDDTPANLRLLIGMLRNAGYKVRPANNGERAFLAIKEYLPDLILLDIMMPGMDGYEVCKRLKADEQTRDIPVIFISALNETVDKVKGFSIGGVDFITKPFQVEEVLARIEMHLTLQRVQQQLKSQNVQLQTEIIRRKQLELALSKSKEKLECFMDSATDYFFHFDQNLNLIDINQIALQLLGLDKKEALGKQLTELSPYVQPAERYEQYQEVIRTGKSFSVDDRVIFSQHKEMYQSIKAFKVGDGLGIIATDITEREIVKQTLEEANKMLQSLASLDGLTQIPNRRRFDEHLRHAWQECLYTQQSLVLILADVDYFKYYNDNYGHLAGDIVLKQVAMAIEQAVRRTQDLAARYGGEEFAVILPNTDIKGGLSLAEQIQQEIEQLNISHDFSEVDQYITLSMGVAMFVPDEQLTIEDLIKSADKALYAAKEAGRNRIVTR
ncbi:diguanylate cyclase [Anaerolineales bacterium HSG25]|nr:diguanylate cyclase [Anaerolineales bacterium HSG25]